MRKLMIAAAAAALTVGAFADAQVYEMSITLKSTVCQKGKKEVRLCDDKIVFTSYRKQVTRKFKGLFWGCFCKTIACPTYYFKGLDFDHDTVAPAQETSYLFWAVTEKTGLIGENESFKWDLLQLVGPKAQNIEGTWTLALGTNDTEMVFNLTGAGYGTANDICSDDAKIKSMSGYVVGINNLQAEIDTTGCKYCGDPSECKPFQFCDCIEANDEETAVFGSWTLKFNSSVAKKLDKGDYIDQAYKFPKYLNLGNYTADDGTGEATDTVKTAAEAAYKTAKEAYETAKAAVEAAEAKQTEAADTKAALTAKKPTGTTQGLALAETYSKAKATTKDAEEDYDDTLQEVIDTKKALDTTMTDADDPNYSQKVLDFIDATNQLALAEKEYNEAQAKTVGKDGYATEDDKKAAVEAAKKAYQAAQDAYNTAEEAYNKAYAKLPAPSQADSNAYKAALEAKVAAENKLTEAQDAETEAEDAIDDWVSGDEKNEKSQAYAKAQAEKNLETLKADANSKEQIMATYRSQCIAVGGSCD